MCGGCFGTLLAVRTPLGGALPTHGSPAPPLRNTTSMRKLPVMNTIMKWALRTAALWALAKVLELANAKLKQLQRDRRLREHASAAAALPRTVPVRSAFPEVEEPVEQSSAPIPH
jgi:hypothetical protein